MPQLRTFRSELRMPEDMDSMDMSSFSQSITFGSKAGYASPSSSTPATVRERVLNISRENSLGTPTDMTQNIPQKVTNISVQSQHIPVEVSGRAEVQTVICSTSAVTIPKATVLDSCGVVNPANNQKISLKQAVQAGIVDLKMETYVDSKTGARLSLQEAASSRFMDSKIVSELYQPCGVFSPTKGKEMTLLETLKEGHVDITSGKLIDPKSGDYMSSQDAQSQGIVKPHFGGAQAMSTTDTQATRAYYGITRMAESSVKVPLSDFMTAGLYDKKTGKLLDPISSEIMTVSDAMRQGVIERDVKEIADPNITGAKMTIVEATSRGIIDPIKGAYVNPQTGRKVLLDDASSRQLISKPLNLAEALCKGRISPGGTVIDKSGRKHSFSEAISQDVLETQNKSVIISATDESISLSEAISKQIISSSGQYIDRAMGQSISISDAVNKGIIKVVEEEVSFPAQCVKDPVSGHMLTLNDAVDKGVVDLQEGMYKNKYGMSVPVTDASRQGLVSGAVVDILRSPSGLRRADGSEISVQEAMQKKMLDPKSGKIMHAATGNVMSIQDAVSLGMIPAIQAQQLISMVSPLTTKKTVVTQIQPVGSDKSSFGSGKNVTQTAVALFQKDNQMMTSDEAIQFEDSDEYVKQTEHSKEKGIWKEKHAYHTYLEDTPVGEVKVHDANITKTATKIITASSIKLPLSVQNAIEKGLLNPQSGTVKNPSSGELIPLQKALEDGILDGDTATFTHPSWGAEYTLGQAVQRRMLDQTGNYTDLQSSQKGTFNELLEKGYITAKGDAGKKIVVSDGQRFLVESVMNPLTRKTISVSEAISKGLVDIVKGTYRNPNTQEVMTIQAAMNQALVFGQALDKMPVKKRDPNDVKAFKIHAVIDPSSGDKVEVGYAISSGIIDQANAEYVKKGKYGTETRIPLTEAVEKELVIAEPRDVKADEEDQTGDSSFTSQALVYSIHRVRDPETRLLITVTEATDKGLIDAAKGQYINTVTNGKMLITEAIQRGLIMADVTFGSSSSSSTDQSSSSKTYTLKAVLHPVTKEELSVKKAIELGILDYAKGAYVNIATGQMVSLSDAIDQRLVIVQEGTDQPKRQKVERRNSVHIDDYLDAVEEMTHEEITEESASFTITGVKDTASGEIITYEEAQDKGIINEKKGIYVNTMTGEPVTITQALNQGLIVGQMVSKTEEHEVFRSDMASHKILEMEIKSVLNPITGLAISVPHAKKLGLINEEKKEYYNPATDEVIPIEDALKEGYLNPSAGHLEKAKPFLPGLHADLATMSEEPRGIVDWHTCSVSVSTTGERITPYAALKQGFIDQATAELLSKKAETLPFHGMSGSQGSLPDFLDEDTLNITVKTMELVSAPEETTEDMDLVETSRATTKPPLVNYSAAVRMGLFDLHNREYYNCKEDTTVTLEQAINAGLLDADDTAFTDLMTGKNFTLREAMASDLISPQGSLNEIEARRSQITLDSTFRRQLQVPMNLIDAVLAGLVDLRSCQITNPRTRQRFTLGEALNKRLIDGKLLAVLDPNSGNKISLDEAIEKKIINPQTGDFMDLHNGQRLLSFNDAYQSGLIESMVNTEAGYILDPVTGIKVPVNEAMKQGLVDLNTVLFYDPNSRNHVIHDRAESLGVINIEKGVYVEHKTGRWIPVKDAVKWGLISFRGAPLLSHKAETYGYATVHSVASKEAATHIIQRERMTTEEPEAPLAVMDRPDDGISAEEIHYNGHDVLDRSDHLVQVSTRVDERSMDFTESFDDFDHQRSPALPATIDVEPTDTQHAVVSTKVYGMDDVPTPVKVERDVKTTITRVMEGDKTKPFHVPGTEQADESPGSLISRIKTIKTKQYVEPSRAPDVESVDSSLSDGYTRRTTVTTTTTRDVTQKPSVISVDVSEGMIIHPVTGEKISASEALEKGLVEIDWNTGYVTNMITAERMTASQALQKGFIDTHIAELIERRLRRGERITTDMITINEALSKGLVIVPLGRIQDPFSGSRMTIEEAIDTRIIDADHSIIIDPANGKLLTLREAIDMRILDPHSGDVRNTATGKTMTFTEFCLEGLIPEHGIKKTRRTLTWEEARRLGFLNLKTGSFRDPETGAVMDIEKAIKLGYITREETITEERRIRVEGIPLDIAIEKGYVDTDAGTFRDPQTGELMSLALAIKRGYITAPSRTPEPQVDSITFHEAWERGLIDIARNTFTEPITGVMMPLDTAIRKGYVILAPMHLGDGLDSTLPETVNSSFDTTIDSMDTPRKTPTRVITRPESESILEFTIVTETKAPEMPRHGFSVGDAISLGYFNTYSGDVSHPISNKLLPLREAIYEEVIDPNTATVIDPTSKQEMTLQQALSSKIMDPNGRLADPQHGSYYTFQEALEQGLVVLRGSHPFRMKKIIVREIIKVLVDYVEDAQTKERYLLPEAVRRGIVSIEESRYINIQTGETMPLSRAHEIGLIQGKVVSRKTSTDELIVDADGGYKRVNEGDGLYSDNRQIHDRDPSLLVTEKTVTATKETRAPNIVQVATNEYYNIIAVVDPRNNRRMPVPEAVEIGIFAQGTGEYIHPITHEVLPLDEAVKQGLVIVQQSQPPEGDEKSFSIEAALDTATNQWLTPQDAISRGILDLDRELFTDRKTGKVMTLDEAVERGLVRGSYTSKVIDTTIDRQTFSIKSVMDPNTREWLHPNVAVDRGILDMPNGLYKNPKSGQTMPIHEAFKKGYIKANEVEENEEEEVVLTASVFKKHLEIFGVIDTRTKEEVSMSEALKRGLLDQQLCTYTNLKTGQEITIEEAIKQGLVITAKRETTPGPVAIAEQIQSYAIKSVIDPRTGEEIPIAEAVRHKIIDKAKGEFLDLKTEETIPISKAIQKGLVITDTIEGSLGKVKVMPITTVYSLKQAKDPSSGQYYDIEEAELRGLISRTEGVYVDPTTGQRIPIKQAITGGLITATQLEDPDYDELPNDPYAFATMEANTEEKRYNISQLVDTKTGEQVSVVEAFRRGLVDPARGTFTDTKSGELMTLNRAMDRGVVQPQMTQDHVSMYSQTPKLTKTFNVTQVVDPRTGHLMNVQDAIEQGILNTDTGHYFNPITGDQITIEDAAQKNLVFISDVTHTSQSHMLDSKNMSYKTGQMSFSSSSMQMMSSSQSTTTGGASAQQPASQHFLSNGQQTNESPGSVNVQQPFNQHFLSSGQQINAPVQSVNAQEPSCHFLANGQQVETPLQTLNSPHQGQHFLGYGPASDPPGTLQGPEIQREDLRAQNGDVDSIDSKGDMDRLSVDTESKSVPEHDLSYSTLDSFTQYDPKVLTLKEAFRRNLVDLKTAMYVDPVTGQNINIDDAIKQEYITVEDDQRYTDPRERSQALTLTESIHRGLINNLGQYIDPKTGERMTADQAFILGKLVVEKPRSVERQYSLETPKELLEKFEKEKSSTPPKGETVTVVETLTKPADIHSVSGQDLSVTDELKSPSVTTGVVSVSKVITDTSVYRPEMLTSESLHGQTRWNASYPGSEQSNVDQYTVQESLRDVSPIRHVDQVQATNGFSSDLKDAGVQQYEPTPPVSQAVADIQKTLEAISTPVSSSVSKREGVSFSQNLFNDSFSSNLLTSCNVSGVILGESSHEFESNLLQSPQKLIGNFLQSPEKNVHIQNLDDKSVFEPRQELPHKRILQDDEIDLIPPKRVSPDKEIPVEVESDKGDLQEAEIEELDEAVSGEPDDMTDDDRKYSPADYRKYTPDDDITKSGEEPQEMEHQIFSPTDEYADDPVPMVDAIKAGMYLPEENVVYTNDGRELTLVEALDGGILTTEKTQVIDPSTGRTVPFDVLVQNGLVNLEAGYVKDSKGYDIPLEDAVNAKMIFDTKQPVDTMTLVDIIEKGLYSPKTGKFEDIVNAEYISLSESLSRGLLDSSSCVVNDPASGEVLSLLESIEYGLTCGKSSKIKDTVAREKVPLTVALERGIVIARPMSVATAVDIGLYNETTAKFLDPTCRQFFSLEEAIKVGLIDAQSTIVDPATGKEMALAIATACGVLDAKQGNVVNVHTGEVISIKQAVPTVRPQPKDLKFALRDLQDKGLYDPRSNMVTHPVTNRQLPLSSAVQCGLIDPKSLILDTATWRRITLQEAVETGILNLETGTVNNTTPMSDCLAEKPAQFSELNVDQLSNLSTSKVIDPLVHDQISISEALDRKILDPHSTIQDPISGKTIMIQEVLKKSLTPVVKVGARDSSELPERPSRMTLQSQPLGQKTLDIVLKENLYDSNTNTVLDPSTGRQLTLQDAIDTGFISPGSVVIHPGSNISLSLKEAEELGVFNTDLGLIIDPKSGESHELYKAKEAGLLPSKPAQKPRAKTPESYPSSPLSPRRKQIRKSPDSPKTSVPVVDLTEILPQQDTRPAKIPTPSGQPDLGSVTFKEALHTSEMLEGKTLIKDASTGHVFSIEEAIEAGIVEAKSGNVKDTETNKFLTMPEAIDRGLVVKEESVEREIPSLDSYIEKDQDTPDTLHQTSDRPEKSFDVKLDLKGKESEQREQEEGISPAGILKQIREKSPAKQQPKEEDVSPVGILGLVREKSPVKQQQAVFAQDIASEAPIREHIDTDIQVSVEPDVPDAVSLQELLNEGRLNLEEGTIIDNDSGRTVSLADAAEQGLFDSEGVEVYNKDSKEMIPFKEAQMIGLVDFKGNMVENGTTVSFKEALNRGYIVDSSMPVTELPRQITAESFMQKEKQSFSSQQDKFETLESPKSSRKLAPRKDTKTPGKDQKAGGSPMNLYKSKGEQVDQVEVTHPELIQTGDNMITSPAFEQISDTVRRVPKAAKDTSFASKTKDIPVEVLDQTDSSARLPPREGLSFITAIQSGQLDPTTGVVLDKDGEKMTLHDALHQNILDYDKTQITDTSTGQKVTLNEAVITGIFDTANASVIDTASGQCLSLNEAVQMGIVTEGPTPVSTSPLGGSARTSHSKETDLPIQVLGDDQPAQTVRTDVVKQEEMEASETEAEQDVSGGTSFVLDSANGDWISMDDAILRGIVDRKTKTIVNTNTGEKLKFDVALSSGLMVADHKPSREKFDIQKIKSYDVSKETDIHLPLEVSVGKGIVHPLKQKDASPDKTPVSLETDSQVPREKFKIIQTSVVEERDEVKSTKESSPTKLTLDASAVITDPSTRQKMNLTKAVSEGIIDSDTGSVIDERSGHKIPLVEAIQTGLVVTQRVQKQETKVIKPTIPAKEQEADKKIVKIPMKEPAEARQSDVQMMKETTEEPTVETNLLVKDTKSHELIPFEKAVKKGLVDADKASVKDSRTGKTVSFSDALSSGLIISDVKPAREKFEIKVQTRKSPVKSKTPDRVSLDASSVITDPATGKKMNVAQAVADGLIDSDTGSIIDKRTGDKIPLVEAVETGLVVQSYSPQREGLDSETTILTLEGSSTLVKDPATGHWMNLDQAIQDRVADIETGTVKDSRNGKAIQFSEALTSGLMVTQTQTLRELKETPRADFEKVTLKEPVVSKRYDQFPFTEKSPGKDSAGFEPHLKTNILVKDTQSQEFMPFDKAVEKGLVDADKASVKDSRTGETVTFSDALSSGLIISDVKPTREKFEIKVQTRKSPVKSKTPDRVSLDASSVITDPATGKKMNVAQAVADGLIDSDTGSIIDKRTGDKIPLVEAVETGLVVQSYSPQRDRLSSETTTVTLEGSSTLVKDPASGHWMNLDQAIQCGVADVQTGTIRDTSSGKVIQFNEALTSGLMVTQTQHPTELKGTPKADRSILDLDLPSTEPVVKMRPKKIKPSPVELAMANNIDPVTGTILDEDQNRKSIADAVKAGELDTSTTAVKHPVTGDPVSVEAALAEGILDPKTASYTNPDTGRPLSFIQAVEQGYVVYSQGPKPLDEAMSHGLYDEETGLFIDPTSKQKLTLQEAVGSIIDADNTLVKDPETGRTVTLHEGIETGVVDPSTGDIILEGQVVPFEQAVSAGLITGTEPTQVKDSQVLSTLEQSYQVNKTIGGSFMDVPGRTFVAGQSREFLSNFDRPDSEELSPRMQDLASEPLPKVEGIGMSLSDALSGGLYDPTTGKITDPSNSMVVTIQEGLTCGLLDAKVKVIRDPVTAEAISVPEAIQKGVLDPETGKYVDATTREILPLTEAQDKGRIVASKTSPTRTSPTRTSPVRTVKVQSPKSEIKQIPVKVIAESPDVIATKLKAVSQAIVKQPLKPGVKSTIGLQKGFDVSFSAPKTKLEKTEPVDLDDPVRKVKLLGDNVGLL